MPVILAVWNLIGSKRHITNYTVKETFRVIRSFKSLHSNGILLVELFCDPAG